MQKYNILITDLALEDIEEIAAFYADLVDYESAERFRADLQATLKSLETLPERHAYWDEESKLRRANLKDHKVSIIYTVDNGVYEVIAIATFHNLENPKKHNEIIGDRVRV